MGPITVICMDHTSLHFGEQSLSGPAIQEARDADPVKIASLPENRRGEVNCSGKKMLKDPADLAMKAWEEWTF
jgi:hypothetical protein